MNCSYLSFLYAEAIHIFRVHRHHEALHQRICPLAMVCLLYFVCWVIGYFSAKRKAVFVVDGVACIQSLYTALSHPRSYFASCNATPSLATFPSSNQSTYRPGCGPHGTTLCQPSFLSYSKQQAANPTPPHPPSAPWHPFPS